VDFLPPIRSVIIISLGLAFGQVTSHALLNVDGTRNQFFTFGRVTYAYNSNLFAEATGRGDYSITASAGLELKRRAGLIGVNAMGKIDYEHFGKYANENALKPNFYLELNKASGRTTGALTLSAFRETLSDSAVNLRTSAWNFPVELKLKYPINDKFYATSDTAYLQRRYTDTTILRNLTTYSEGLDLFYVYTSKLDLLAGYRVRLAQTTQGLDATDHWFNVGASGGLFAKLNGTVRLGYQLRQAEGGRENFAHINALAALGWPVTRKLRLAGQLSRDFNTIATGASVDISSVGVRAIYAYSRKLEFDTGIAYGRNAFLGATQAQREDTFLSADLGARFKLNEYVSLAASYTYLHNWSSLNFADFVRQGVSFDLSSRF
jgi:hypothetical protein